MFTQIIIICVQKILPWTWSKLTSFHPKSRGQWEVSCLSTRTSSWISLRVRVTLIEGQNNFSESKIKLKVSFNVIFWTNLHSVQKNILCSWEKNLVDNTFVFNFLNYDRGPSFAQKIDANEIKLVSPKTDLVEVRFLDWISLRIPVPSMPIRQIYRFLSLTTTPEIFISVSRPTTITGWQ